MDTTTTTETRTLSLQERVIEMCVASGIRHKHDWREYERAKCVVMWMDLNDADYYRALNYVADWLGL